MPKKKPASRGKYVRERKKSPKKFAKGSFRTIKAGKKKLIVGCPKRKWDPKKVWKKAGKTIKGKCKAGMQVQSVLHPMKKNPTKTEVWKKIPKDYKSVIRGKKYVLIRTDRGAVLAPLSSLSSKEVAQLMGKKNPGYTTGRGRTEKKKKAKRVMKKNPRASKKKKAKPGSDDDLEFEFDFDLGDNRGGFA